MIDRETELKELASKGVITSRKTPITDILSNRLYVVKPSKLLSLDTFFERSTENGITSVFDTHKYLFKYDPNYVDIAVSCKDRYKLPYLNTFELHLIYDEIDPTGVIQEGISIEDDVYWSNGSFYVNLREKDILPISDYFSSLKFKDSISVNFVKELLLRLKEDSLTEQSHEYQIIKKFKTR